MIRHDSQRGYFAYELYREMQKNDHIYLICCDLGYKVFDQHFKDFPDRSINTGAAEQTALDMAVGLALSNKIPFVYSITPFLLYRPFETLRTYINHENIPVKLIGSGRDSDYHVDGFSHYAGDDLTILKNLQSIKYFHPKTKEEIPEIVRFSVADNNPIYINLTR